MQIEFRPITLRLPHISLHALEAGQGPLALMFHGITGSGYVFEPVIEGLRGQFHCLSFDQRGHGRSDKPESGYASRDFVEDIAAIVRHLDAGPALLIGHSLGSRNALEAGAKYPDLVAGVVGIEFVPYIETQVFDDLDARVGGGDRVFASIEAIEAYLADRYRLMPAEAVSRRAKYGYRKTDSGWRPLADPRAMAQICTGLREDLEPALNSIRVPTLLIRGAASKLVSSEAWARAKALRPDISAVELEGADHYVQEEIPQPVVREILLFSKTIKQRKRTP